MKMLNILFILINCPNCGIYLTKRNFHRINFVSQLILFRWRLYQKNIFYLFEFCIKIFNHFYKTEVALKITDTKYQNQFLNQFTVSRKFKDQSNFTSGYQATGIAEENISFLVT